MNERMTRVLTSGRGRYAVRCQEYVRRFRTRELAEGFLGRLEHDGACPYAHEVVDLEEEPSDA